jgi:short-subunit dehydrogenase
MMRHVEDADFRARYGPWALVAGASAGLGAVFAVQLAARGLNLVLIARRKEALDELATTLMHDYAIEVRTLQFDLGSDDSESVIMAATSDLEIGLLVYNAATVITGPYFEITLQDHLKEIAVNCKGLLTLAYILGQHMLKRRRGGMVFMSSLSSFQGSALIANYAATKAYSRILGEGLWEELRTQGIDVVTCSPSAISTPAYLADASSRSGRISSATMMPREVAAETLAALGKEPVVIPGWGNRLANVLMQRVFPRKMAIGLMGRVMRRMYQEG